MAIPASKSAVQPIYAALYGPKQRQELAHLIVRDMDSAQNIWGGPDRTLAFRNVLVGAPSQRTETWQSWLGLGIIETRDRPAFFILRQSYLYGGKKLERWALFAALAIDDRNIFIHEDVVPEGVERSRQATEACEGDLAPIFVGYDEVLSDLIRKNLQSLVAGEKPCLEYQEPENPSQFHTVWEIADAQKIQQIQSLFRGEKLFLLDGHHRLAAAKENHRKGMGDGKILACVCSLSAEDTLILPIHRAIHYGPWILPEQVMEDWSRVGCLVKELEIVNAKAIEEQCAHLLKHELSCLFLHAHSKRIIQIKFPASLSQISMQMQDMAVAHLEYYLDKHFSQASVIPVADAKLALEQLALEQAQVAFFLPGLSPNQVKGVAQSGLRLPRKSTRFVPKPALGLIMRPWR